MLVSHFSKHLIKQENFLLFYYHELSWALFRCFVLCVRPEFFTSTYCRACSMSTELSEFEFAISASHIEVSLLDSSTEEPSTSSP
jgi:hypothetical protein